MGLLNSLGLKPRVQADSTRAAPWSTAGSDVVVEDGGTAGLASAWRYGQEELPADKPALPPLAKKTDAPKESEPVYASADEAREALRDLVFIKGTARALLGQHGNHGEFVGAVAKFKDGESERFAVVNVHPGEEHHAQVSPTEYRNVISLIGDGSGQLQEVIHSHPSGIRAFMELGAGTNQFSDADEDFVKETGVPLGLLTPSGEIKLKDSAQRSAKSVLAGEKQPRIGRKEFVPDRPDLRALIEREIMTLVDQEVDLITSFVENPKKQKRKLDHLHRVRDRALKRLAKMDLSG
jgi:hypothetical protein